MIQRFTGMSPVLRFGDRYRLKKLEEEREKILHIMPMGFSSTALGAVSLISGPGGVVPMLAGVASFASDSSDLWEMNHKIAELKKASEPAPDPPELSLRKALEKMDLERRNQRSLKDALVQKWADELARLEEMKGQFNQKKAALSPADTQLPLLDELEYHQKRIELEAQEKTVATLKTNADAAIAIDNRFEAQMQEMKKRYFEMMAKLQQIENNKKLLEMQKNLETLKGAEFEPPEIQKLNEQIEADLSKTEAQVDAFLAEAQTLRHLQNPDSTSPKMPF